MTYEKNAKKCIDLRCEKCNFATSNKFNYNKHLLSLKHKRLTDDLQKDTKNCQTIFECVCGKKYVHRQSLYNHRKKCKDNMEKANNSIFDKNNDENILDYKSMFLEIINENKEMRSLLMKQQEQISDMIPKVGNYNNNIKQKFNINVFLNEKCKDALSIDEFINKIEISMKNLLTTKEKGN